VTCNHHNQQRGQSYESEGDLNEYYRLGKDVTLSEYIKFCEYAPDTCYEQISRFCHEQFINNYHLFATDLVVHSLLNEYQFPRGLVASLCDNVKRFTEHLKTRSQSSLNQEDHYETSQSETEDSE
jgi:hypothetical protein